MKRIRSSPGCRTSRGFAIVSAIFLLVVLVALGAFMLTFSNTQHATSAQDIQGSRALAAARSGIQWAAGNLNSATPTCFASPTTLNLEGFTINVTCVSRDYTEGSPPLRRIFWVVSTASTGGAVGNLDYVERQVSSFIEF